MSAGLKMLEGYLNPSPHRRTGLPSSYPHSSADQKGEKSLEARLKRDYADLYPGVDPQVWYRVVQAGEYRDDMEGLWIQVNDWVTYVLAKHFDLQSRTAMH
jgi:hypothetical protein